MSKVPATPPYRTIEEGPQVKVAGYPNNVPTTRSVKIRGTGAATKGTTARGQMG